MKSRITIEVDFDNGQPYMKVMEDRTSDDVRDKLITFFRQRLGHTSSWCRVIFREELNPMSWEIHPIRPDELEEQSKIISEQVRLNNAVPWQNEVSH